MEAIRRLDGGPDHDESAVRTGDGALDQEQIAFGIGLDDLEVQHRDALVPVLARHPHPLEDPRRRSARADRPGRAMLLLRAVARAQAGEPVATHDAREPLAARDADDVRAFARGEDVRSQLLAGRVARGVVRPELDEMTARLAAVRVEVTLHGLVRRGLGERELHGVVAVGLLRLDLRDEARPGLDDRDRNRAGLLEDLGHAQLLAQDAFDLAHSLISMSTPAERFRRWSSWTVFDVASTMSMIRLCVSIWKCSRESLYLCGDRMTV
jgi:hypothetical protein